MIEAPELACEVKAPPLPDIEANKRARAELKLLWLSDPSQKEKIRQRCAEDFVFWVEHFVMAHDDNAPPNKKIQYVVLWDIQKEISAVIIENVWRCAKDPNEEWNAYGDKARYMAWTFLNTLIIQWFWQFHDISSTITSKTKDDVDSKADMDTPLQKIRWQIDEMYAKVPWLFPEKFDPHNNEEYKKGLIAVPGGGKITGKGPKGKEMRQGRALIWFGDELPHTENDEELWDAACGTVRVRIVGGTPNIQRGKNCKAYKLRYNKNPGETCHLFELPWYRDPRRAQGLYKCPDGTLSSPWMDGQKSTKSRQTIAAEYLMDWDVAAGRPPLYAFREDCHVPGLQPDPMGGPIYCAWDPGKHFGVTWVQQDRFGRFLHFRELYLTPEDAPPGKTLLDTVAEKVKWLNLHKYRDFDIIHVGDPYGSRTQLSMQLDSEYDLLLRNHQIRVQSAYVYSIAAEQRKKLRINILNDLMGKDCLPSTGKRTPMFLIDKLTCPLTYEAIKQGYRWKIVDGKETDEVTKSHPDGEMIDTIGYAAVKIYHKMGDQQGTNGGGGRRTTGKPKIKKQPMNWRRSGRNMGYA